jgi:hypothetical protein
MKKKKIFQNFNSLFLGITKMQITGFGKTGPIYSRVFVNMEVMVTLMSPESEAELPKDNRKSFV